MSACGGRKSEFWEKMKVLPRFGRDLVARGSAASAAARPGQGTHASLPHAHSNMHMKHLQVFTRDGIIWKAKGGAASKHGSCFSPLSSWSLDVW